MIVLFSLVFGGFLGAYTEDQAENDMRDKEFESGRAAVKEEESKTRDGFGYVRLWNFSAWDAAPVAVCARVKGADAEQPPTPLTFEMAAGETKRYRRLPAGTYEITLHPAVRPDLSSPDSAGKPPDWKAMKKLAVIDTVKIEKDQCITLLVQGTGKPQIEVLEEPPSEQAGIHIRQMIPGIEVGFGYSQGGTDKILADKMGQGTRFLPWPGPAERRPFFVSFPTEFDTIGRNDFELDLRFCPVHTVIIHKDRYGRVSATATEDGLKAALASQ
ncbi:MAG: hypothetical protein SFU85_05560 [Candidatus Methylacidiphilales bacterium]|nr:hypothetical protein [Candidatus Methylacidiphilales bacterium]